MDRTEPSDHILMQLTSGYVVDADALIVSPVQRAAGGDQIEFGFRIPDNAPTEEYVCILAKLRQSVRPRIIL